MIYKDGVLMTLTVTKWGGAKKLEPQDLGFKPMRYPNLCAWAKNS